MVRTLPHFAALMLLVSSGLILGHWSRSAHRELDGRVAGLERVPLAIGDWVGQSLALDPRAVEMGEIAGYLMRRYENQRGEAVTLLIVCGRPGPIAAHTPEVCYGGIGYEPAAERARFPIGPGPGPAGDVFWAMDLVRSGPVPDHRLRILYAWNADGTWRASDRPRLELADAQALYKIYIVREVAGAAGPIPDDPTLDFSRRLLPALRKALFPTA